MVCGSDSKELYRIENCGGSVLNGMVYMAVLCFKTANSSGDADSNDICNWKRQAHASCKDVIHTAKTRNRFVTYQPDWIMVFSDFHSNSICRHFKVLMQTASGKSHGHLTENFKEVFERWVLL